MARAGFQQALAGFRGLGMRFHTGVALAEFGQWLQSEGEVDEANAVLAEAREIFEDLKATWWLDRLDQSRQSTSAIG